MKQLTEFSSGISWRVCIWCSMCPPLAETPGECVCESCKYFCWSCCASCHPVSAAVHFFTIGMVFGFRLSLRNEMLECLQHCTQHLIVTWTEVSSV